MYKYDSFLWKLQIATLKKIYISIRENNLECQSFIYYVVLSRIRHNDLGWMNSKMYKHMDMS